MIQKRQPWHELLSNNLHFFQIDHPSVLEEHFLVFTHTRIFENSTAEDSLLQWLRGRTYRVWLIGSGILLLGLGMWLGWEGLQHIV